MTEATLADQRVALQRRLEREFDDHALAATVANDVAHDIVERLGQRIADDFESAPLLSYRPPVVAADQIDSLWILAFGYRFAEGADATPLDMNGSAPIPPMSDLVPGPVNEALAQAAAAFVVETPVPIVAQWEAARVLQTLGVPNVISVEPDEADDGSVDYLSTFGVLEKGLRLAAEAGVSVGRAGVLGHNDHVNRCLMAAREVGLTAAVPEGVVLPSSFDAESGQAWTRSRTAYLMVDLLARSYAS